MKNTTLVSQNYIVGTKGLNLFDVCMEMPVERTEKPDKLNKLYIQISRQFCLRAFSGYHITLIINQYIRFSKHAIIPSFSFLYSG